MRVLLSVALAWALVSPSLFAQFPPMPKPATPPPVLPGVPAAPHASTPGQSPSTVPAVAAPAVTAPATQPARATPTAGGGLNLNLTNASLTEVIDILARDLHINYILDPAVTGKVTINTYGEMKALDVRNLLETILRMNGYTMVQVGNIYRIIKSADASHLPVSPTSDAANIPDNEQPVLSLVFLKYVTAAEMAKLLDSFTGEGSKMVAYEPANLLILMDNARNMRRTLELIGTFDAETMANQRVQTFSLSNSRPSDVSKELETIFKGYAISDKASAVRFIAIDRISTIIAIANNPTAFHDVKTWVEKLDVPARVNAGSTDNHVYKLKYGRAEIVGAVVAQLYGVNLAGGVSGYGLTGYGGYSRGVGGNGGNSGFGGSGFGSGSNTGLGSNNGVGGSSFGSNNGLGGNGFGANGLNSGNAASGQFGGGSNLGTSTFSGQSAGGASTGTAATTNTPFGSAVSSTTDQTGQYLAPSTNNNPKGPRIVPNPFDNTLLVQSTAEQWSSILNLLNEIDVSPRQVLIDAKIYEVDLTGALQYGVEATLQANNPSTSRSLLGSVNGTVGATLTAGTLVGQSRELLATVTALESRTLAKSISAPQIIATDSIPASITVGSEVPTTSAVSVATGLGGATTSAIQNVGTGVNLNIIARVNASGVVTMVIDQDISAAQPNTSSGIDSPSFSERNVSTQITVQDGDTVAIGGIIQDTKTSVVSGIPFLDRLPYIGGVFGSKSYNTSRTELIVFLTPHVIYDTTQITDATEEIKQQMRLLKKDVRNQ